MLVFRESLSERGWFVFHETHAFGMGFLLARQSVF